MFAPGERIFMPGAAGQPVALTDAVLGTARANIWTTFLPGVNPIDPDKLGEGAHVTGLFAHSSVIRRRPESFRHLPVSYAGFLQLLRRGLAFDATVVQVSPPDAHGLSSLGPMVEFSEFALRRATRTIAVVNHRLRELPSAPKLPLSGFTTVLEADTPLPVYHAEPDDVARAIARRVAEFIDDGCALQIGLGKIPQALYAELRDRKRLRLHSGMLSEGVIGLCSAGALDNSWPHRATALLGATVLYEWAQGEPRISLAGCEAIHDIRVLAAIEGLVAVNSALEVDLAGQCNLEVAAGMAVSGPGGAPDFARAAAQSFGGCSIVALPSTVNGRGSRIVARLPPESVVSLGRSDVDVVVTEEGVADLRGKSAVERAQALLAIAAPAARGDLERAWRAGFSG